MNTYKVTHANKNWHIVPARTVAEADALASFHYPEDGVIVSCVLDNKGD